MSASPAMASAAIALAAANQHGGPVTQVGTAPIPASVMLAATGWTLFVIVATPICRRLYNRDKCGSPSFDMLEASMIAVAVWIVTPAFGALVYWFIHSLIEVLHA